MFNFTEYMRRLSAEYAEIAHSQSDKRFYRLSGIRSLEEVLSNLLSARVPAIGVDDNLEGRIISNQSDALFDRQHCIFYIFGKVNLLDHNQREAQKRKTKQIALKFVSRILADHRSDFNLETSHGLRHLDIGSFSYRTIGPLAEGLIALAVSFVVDTSLTPLVNPLEWNAPES